MIDVLHHRVLVAECDQQPTCATHGTLARRPGTATISVLHFLWRSDMECTRELHHLYLVASSSLAGRSCTHANLPLVGKYTNLLRRRYVMEAHAGRSPMYFR